MNTDEAENIWYAEAGVQSIEATIEVAHVLSEGNEKNNARTLRLNVEERESLLVQLDAATGIP